MRGLYGPLLEIHVGPTAMAHRAEGGDLDLVRVSQWSLVTTTACGFQECYARYIAAHASRGDRPCFFARVKDRRFNTESTDDPRDLPCGVLLRRDVLPRRPNWPNVDGKLTPRWDSGLPRFWDCRTPRRRFYG